MNLENIKSSVIAFLVSKAGVVSAAIASFIVAHILAGYHVYLGSVEVALGFNDTDLSTWMNGIVFAAFMAGIGWIKTHWTTEANKKAQELISQATGIELKNDGVLGKVTLGALETALENAKPSTNKTP